MRRLLATTASALAILVGVAAFSEPAEAATARCGMLLTTKAKMTRDLDCSNASRPIRLQGPRAHLDLNGFELSCGPSDRTNPLRLQGRGTLLRNGILRDCTIEVLEKGDHKLRFLTIENFDGAGVVIRSNSNEVTNNAIQSDGNGLVVESGTFNLVGDNSIFGDGAALILQNRSYVVNNRLESGGGGVQLLGNRNRVVFNDIVNTCIHDDGQANLVGGNTVDEELCDPEPEPTPEPEVPEPIDPEPETTPIDVDPEPEVVDPDGRPVE